MRRRALAAQALGANGLDSYVVSKHSDIAYLCGFTGSSGVLVMTAEPDSAAVLVTDDRYTERAASEAPGIEVRPSRETWIEVAGALRDWGAGNVGADSRSLTWSERDALASELSPGQSLSAAPGLIDPLRASKDGDEVAAITAACAVTDRAFAGLLEWLRPGRREMDVAREFSRLVLTHGGEGLAFDTIVASGPNAAVPHHDPGVRELVDGDLVILDLGAKVGGYCADMTRTVVVGAASAWQLEIYAVVLEAQGAGRSSARAGALAGDVDQSARQVIDAAGYGEAFLHGTGHGIGLDVHEAPILTRNAVDRLGESFTVTVEPGIYLPGLGGVRIEDTVLIGPDGAESLTRTPRELVAVT